MSAMDGKSAFSIWYMHSDPGEREIVALCLRTLANIMKQDESAPMYVWTANQNIARIPRETMEKLAPKNPKELLDEHWMNLVAQFKFRSIPINNGFERVNNLSHGM